MTAATADTGFARLAPDAPAGHAALKAVRERVRSGNVREALALLAGPECRDIPLAGLLRADLLLAEGRTQEAETLALALCAGHGDTAQGLLCAGHAALARGDRVTAGARFRRAAEADPGRLAARVNAAAFDPPDTAPAHGPRRTAAAVTSLPPTAGARHRLAVDALAAAGFAPIVSVNAPGEIDGLRRAFPDVAFAVGPKTAVPDFGRPYAPIAGLLAVGASSGADCVAVVNADAAIVAGPGFAARLAREARGGAVVACRADVEEATSPEGVFYDVGFDLCAVDAALAGSLEMGGFFLGLPWWDYALPLAVAGAGGAVRFAPAPVLRHAAHAQAWSHRAFLALGRRFVRRFWPLAAETFFPPGEAAANGEAEACLAGIGARVASYLRRQPEVRPEPVRAFCPHDPGYAAAPLPLTRVRFTLP